jgi:prepilin-type N-terminal cleavage/methylation domain-containing protein
MKTNIKKSKISAGFTLVEMMIAVGLFSVIMTIGIGAILGVNSTHRKTQTMRAVIDNLSFLMEDMARSIRLGDYYYCQDAAPTLLDLTSSDPQNPQASLDGEDCSSISFEPFWQFSPSDVANQIVYHITEINDVGTIVKKTETDSISNIGEWDPVTPSEVNIDIVRSGFTVTGAGNALDNQQPKATIVLVGTVRISGVSTEFNLQSTVSQRALDINVTP